MKVLFSIFITLTALQLGFAQKYMTQSGQIQFFSETPVENIEAINNQVSTVIDLGNGKMAFSLLMKAFTFEKALMQEHFNEKYVESEKFPKSTFKGEIEDFEELNLTNEWQEVDVSGMLTIHGITKAIKSKAMLMKNEAGNILGKTEFEIEPEEYEIKIPSAVKDKIAKTIAISVNAEYEAL